MEKDNQVYRIRVRGNLDPNWSEWMGGMSITAEQKAVGFPNTVLVGPLPDQAALRGILNRLWDLNLEVISVNRIGTRRKVK